MEYQYANGTVSPNLEGIHLDVSNSSMVDKGIEWCRWDESTQILRVVFTNELSVDDKSILDTIVSNNIA